MRVVCFFITNKRLYYFVIVTIKGAKFHRKDETEFICADFFNIFNSLSRIFVIRLRNDNSHP